MIADLHLTICILVVVYGLLEAFRAEPKHVGYVIQAYLKDSAASKTILLSVSSSMHKLIGGTSLCERLARYLSLGVQALTIGQFLQFWVGCFVLRPGIIIVNCKTARVYCTTASLFVIRRYRDTGRILFYVEQVVVSIDGAFDRRSH